MADPASSSDSSTDRSDSASPSASASASGSQDTAEVARAGEAARSGMQGETARSAMSSPQAQGVLADTARSVGNTPQPDVTSGITTDPNPATQPQAQTGSGATPAPDPAKMAQDIVDANTTTRNQRGGQPPKETVNVNGVAADIVHMSRTDPELAGAVFNEARTLVDKDALDTVVNETLNEAHLADAALLGDGDPTAIDADAAQTTAAGIIAQNTNTRTMRGGTRTEVDVTEIAYDLQTLAKENPSLAVAAKAEVTASLNAKQAADVNRMLSGNASLGEELDMAFSHPVEGLKGVGKGIVNGFSALGEMVAKGSVMNAAAEQQRAAGFSALVGNDAMAQRQADLGTEMMDAAMTEDFVPEMSIDNMAQAGGEKVGFAIDVAMAGKGLITGGAKVLARNADELAALGARNSDELAGLAVRNADELPNAGSLSNIEARSWYLEQERLIPDRIDRSLPLEGQAQQAHALRNDARTTARDVMSDRELAEQITRDNPNLTWDQLVEKTRAKGFEGDDIFREIIESSQRSRQSVNKKLGLD